MPWTAVCQAFLSTTSSQSLLKLLFIESVVVPSNSLILCYPLLLPSIFPSIRSFSMSQFFIWGVQSIGFQLQHQFSSVQLLSQIWLLQPRGLLFPINIYSGLISLRIDQLDLLAVILKENLESLFQHLSSKALILQHSAFFMVQLSHPYMTTAETIALTRWTFVGKVMSLLFNMLSRLVIAFFQGASVF